MARKAKQGEGGQRGGGAAWFVWNRGLVGSYEGYEGEERSDWGRGGGHNLDHKF